MFSSFFWSSFITEGNVKNNRNENKNCKICKTRIPSGILYMTIIEKFLMHFGIKPLFFTASETKTGMY